MGKEEDTSASDNQNSDRIADLERDGEEYGHVLDARRISPGTSAIPTAQDGHTILIPQPSKHPLDPLNWNWRRKHITLFTITMLSMLADIGSALEIPL